MVPSLRLQLVRQQADRRGPRNDSPAANRERWTQMCATCSARPGTSRALP